MYARARSDRESSVRPRERDREIEERRDRQRKARPCADLRNFPLWNDATGPVPGDVRQGATGDCWALSTLAALASAHPEQLKSIIKLKPDGRYSVLLDKEIDVGPMIDCTYGWFSSTPAPVSSAHFTRAAWVVVMEKAIAKRNVLDRVCSTSFDRLESGRAACLMGVLRSDPPTHIVIEGNGDLRGVLDDVKDAVLAKRLVVASIRVRSLFDSDGGHAYAVIGATEHGFELYDPYGKSILLSRDEFLKRTYRVTISGDRTPAAWDQHGGPRTALEVGDQALGDAVAVEQI